MRRLGISKQVRNHLPTSAENDQSLTDDGDRTIQVVIGGIAGARKSETSVLEPMESLLNRCYRHPLLSFHRRGTIL